MKIQTIMFAGLLIAANVLPVQAQPRHIYRDGNYFFCPYPDFDPYCKLPNDYSAALRPHIDPPVPEGRPGPPVLVPMQGQFGPPEMSMEQERENIIRQGEAHCAKYPQDTVVCHPPKPQ